jgi:hypothetical protein
MSWFELSNGQMTSANGTFEKCSDFRYLVAIGGKADVRFDRRDFAVQAQAPAAMLCEDPSRRRMLSEGRVRESPVPLPWWIVHGSENRGWSSADCRSPASALARISIRAD